MGWTAYFKVTDCSNSSKPLAGVHAQLLAKPNSQGYTNSVGECSLGDGAIDDLVQSIGVRLTFFGYATIDVTIPQQNPGAGGPSLPPQPRCMNAVASGGGSGSGGGVTPQPADSWEKTYGLLTNVNTQTLGRIENQAKGIQTLLKAVNEVTLKRMEDRLKDIQSTIKE